MWAEFGKTMIGQIDLWRKLKDLLTESIDRCTGLWVGFRRGVSTL